MTAATHSNALEAWRPPSPRTATIALGVGLALLAVCLVAGLMYPQSFFQAYLYGYLFWWTASMGCLGLTLLHNLTGGHWGMAIRPFLHAGLKTVLLAAVLFLPLLFGLSRIYDWAHYERFDEQLAQTDPILAGKVDYYLNSTFFIWRAIGYFAIWFVAAAIARRGSRRPSAISLTILILAVSFAAVDWAMSLEPHWFSTMYGALYVAGGAVAAMALSIVFLGNLVPAGAESETYTADVFNDLGNLLLAFVMIWTYFSFSQFLIIWSGNLPEENVWYLRRAESGWLTLAIVIALLHFVVPFLLLLSRDIKRNPKLIAAVAGGLLVMRAVDLMWVVAPSFSEHGVLALVLDVLALLGIGGLWIAVFCWSLRPPEPMRHRPKHGKKKGAV